MVNASITAYAENPKNELNPLLMSLQKSEEEKEIQKLKDHQSIRHQHARMPPKPRVAAPKLPSKSAT
jgi:hypothetical protein